MTVPTPSPTTPRGPLPPRIGFLTVPLMINLIYSAITLLFLPFAGPTLTDTTSEMVKQMGIPDLTVTPAQVQTALWISFGLTTLQILWVYYTRRAVLDGRNWGRVSSIVLAVFSLLIPPIFTILGIVMLIGAFDKQVVAYTSR
ncbi:hypothetical protein GCM10008956_19880 [Deinococcus arenae]|uniref:Uncharacterized protein n=1 Tax=Deinococcus arenae TaxID=1452751 RepID=A0A8H9GQG7_9DEIO|nr:hypothetical protein [Deinococcus arenae]AWT36468.1 hypothetical protein DM785_13525 [Deinococcus actinosclerus]GGM43634.1 hypothetical protein GCM10008956_19880 [Deinococcus arenae]